MNEWTLVWQAVPKIALLGIFMMTYIIGGRTKKWIRRWVGGSVMAAGLVGMSLYEGSFSWLFAASTTGIFAGLVMGYGGETITEKTIRRAAYGFTLGAAAVGIGWAQGVLLFGVFQGITAVFTSVYMGVVNPAKSAVDEEAVIAVFSTAALPFMV